MNPALKFKFERRRLRFLFDTKTGSTPKSSEESYWDGAIPWVTPEDLGKLDGKYLYATRRTISEEGYRNTGVELVPENSIVLSKRAPIGQAAIIGMPATCNQGCFLLVSKGEVDERFYYYALVHLRSYLESLGRGSTFMELATGDLRSVELPFPPLETQRRIADYLDRETARIDALVAEKEKMLALLEEKRFSLIDLAINHPETEMIRVCNVAELVGRPIPRKDDDAYTPLGLFNRGRGIFHKPITLGCDLGDSDFYFVRKGDLIISGQFAWEGAVAVAGASEDGCVVSHRYHVYKGRDGVLDTHYFWAYLTTQTGDMILNDHSRGAAGRNRPLNPNTLAKEKIPVPPYDLQVAISDHVKHEERIKIAIEESKSLLSEHRAALITAAVSGQLNLEEIAA